MGCVFFVLWLLPIEVEPADSSAGSSQIHVHAHVDQHIAAQNLRRLVGVIVQVLRLRWLLQSLLGHLKHGFRLDAGPAKADLVRVYVTVVDDSIDLERGWCAGRNPPSVLDGIQLNGLPASCTVTHRRLFALPPRRTAVSPFPPSLLGDLARLNVTGLVDVPFLFWSQGSHLTPCGIADRVVNGVSSNTTSPCFRAR